MKQLNDPMRYDEASSSDDSSLEEEAENEEEVDSELQLVCRAHSEQGLRELPRDDGVSSVENDSNNDEEDSSLVRSFVKGNGCEDQENNSDDSTDDSEDEIDLPLHERISRMEKRGVPQGYKREQKRSALEIASERLADYKKLKQESPMKKCSTVPSSEAKKKKSKHAPTEVSSKRAEYYKRGLRRLNECGVGVEIGAHKYKAMDPRISSLSGHFNQEHFERNYEFLQKIRDKEIAQLKRQISARRQTGKKGQRMRQRMKLTGGSLAEDEEHLKRLQQETAELKRRKLERTAKQAVKRKIRDEVAEGKRGAYFLKRKEKKRLEFEAKMEELRKSGGDQAVEKALAKRRRKAKSRDAGLFAK